MNVTITFRKDTKADHKGRRNIFESKKEIQKYFRKLYKKNNSFFFYKRMKNKIPMRIDINKGDELYFLFGDEVIATAIYTGVWIEEGKKYKNKFTFGYQLEKIRLFCPAISLKEGLPEKYRKAKILNEK